MAFIHHPKIQIDPFTNFLEKNSVFNAFAHISLIILIILSNIYNTTPNKQIIIGYLMNHSIQAKKKENSKLRDLENKKHTDQDLKETEKINHLIIPDSIDEEETPMIASNLSNNSASKNLFEEYVSQDAQAEKSRV